MKRLFLAVIALSNVAAYAQVTPFDRIQQIHTSLNHLTVIDLGEPVIDLAIADREAFQVERHDNKVFLMPLRESVATNLFIWTSTRQLSYEVDPAGDLTKMDVLVQNLPPRAAARTASDSPSDIEIRKIATLALSEALFGEEEIQADGKSPSSNTVSVKLTHVFRAKDQIYIRYTILNSSQSPFRITPPDVYQPTPTQLPISLVSLKNHQMSEQTYAAFKAKTGSIVPLVSSQTQATDLAPGAHTVGLMSIRVLGNNAPQLYQLQFGSSQSKAIVADVVL